VGLLDKHLTFLLIRFNQQCLLGRKDPTFYECFQQGTAHVAAANQGQFHLISEDESKRNWNKFNLLSFQ
jgi:hypothetical protein